MTSQADPEFLSARAALVELLGQGDLPNALHAAMRAKVPYVASAGRF
jgi:hypothetical protein